MRVPVSPQANKVELRDAQFRQLLLDWYDVNARDLPWRKSRDPYRVWVSEIMLQQTRVAAVLEHYRQFLLRFPTVEKLASAREASVLAAWSGLGYYRRARMLHAAAKVVARERGGKFPETAEAWRELPGIGRYTSAAIASIAFGEPVAVVDGNVERVLERVAGQRLSQAEVWRVADERLDRQRPGDFNQAMMELGAVVCTPRAPLCLTCPVSELCATRGVMDSLEKSARQIKREVHYALDCCDGKVLLVQRPRDASLMAGMWELPEVAAVVPRSGEKQIRRFARNDQTRRKAVSEGSETSPRKELNVPLFMVKHSITVTDYSVSVWACTAGNREHGAWFPSKKLPKIALTGLARKILRKAGLLNKVDAWNSSAE